MQLITVCLGLKDILGIWLFLKCTFWLWLKRKMKGHVCMHACVCVGGRLNTIWIDTFERSCMFVCVCITVTNISTSLSSLL